MRKNFGQLNEQYGFKAEEFVNDGKIISHRHLQNGFPLHGI